ncbi:hypothetical protein PMAYCL1PPCAC_02315, partial [Pristionchus mayeri]
MEQFRRQFQNVFWYLKWRAARALNRNSTLKPIAWREKRRVEVLQSVVDEKILDTIRREIELYSSLSDYFPKREINEYAWKVLTKCENMKQRIDHIKFLRLNEIKREKDEEKKAKAKEARRREEQEYTSSAPTNCLVTYRETRQREQYQRIATSLRTERGVMPLPRVAIDCRFLPLLSPRGANLTATQIQYIISENRERPLPWPLTLARFDQSSEEIKRLRKRSLPILNGSSLDVIPDVSDRNLRDLFPPSSCVYLSPEGEYELEEIEDDKVYIIGGIVDRVTEKGIPKEASNEAAIEEGIISARLPIARYVKWQSGNRFLTLNAVIGILHDVFEKGGRGDEAWTYAMQRNIPVRNVRAAEEKNDMARVKHSRIREYDRQIRVIIERELSR